MAAATVLRARKSTCSSERLSESLGQALAESERARAALSTANEELQRRNVELRTLHIAVGEGFALIDERTRGRLRELVEEAGDDLAALVDDALDHRGRRV